MPITDTPHAPVSDAPQVVLGDVASDERFTMIESCHSTWLFDLVEHRFCRVLKNDPTPDAPVVWRDYDRLSQSEGSAAFIVFLDASGTRLLRSWKHDRDCDRCGGEVTAQMSLADLRRIGGA